MENDVIFENKQRLGLIRLNRPKALNALTLPMVRAIQTQLDAWAQEEEINSIVIVGEGDRAFCAGGDIKGLYQSGLGDGVLAAEFFREEYELDYRLATFAKPVISILDGATMGGGVGLSLHGTVRVATEGTLFAMPETSIGLFPDVGSSHFLSRLPDGLGLFLGLTGQRLKAWDCLDIGVATHFVSCESIDQLLVALEASDNALLTVEQFDNRQQLEKNSVLLEHRDLIQEAFGRKKLEDIVNFLSEVDTDWRRKQLAKLLACSPTSLKVTLEQIERAASLSLAEVFMMDYRISQACMKGNDFFEGVRALLIDKDQSPKWKPDSLDGVDETRVVSHFTTLIGQELALD